MSDAGFVRSMTEECQSREIFHQVFRVQSARDNAEDSFLGSWPIQSKSPAGRARLTTAPPPSRASQPSHSKRLSSNSGPAVSPFRSNLNHRNSEKPPVPSQKDY